MFLLILLVGVASLTFWPASVRQGAERTSRDRVDHSAGCEFI